MQMRAHSIRNRMMVLGAVALAVMLAAPVAGARDRYHGGGGHGADIVGALVVGAVIGGVLASASQNRGDAYYGGGYYPPPAYAPPAPVYYQPYPAYPAYPAYAQPAYGGVSIGVVYSNGPRGHWNRGGRGHYYHGR